MEFDLSQTDELLATTRAVRKRLDLDRPVPRDVIETCIGLSQQAPTGSNTQTWRWIIVEDAAKRERLAELYRIAADGYLAFASKNAADAGDKQTGRVLDSAMYLAENLGKVPVHVIPCLMGRPPRDAPPLAMVGMMASIFPAVWSFQLALRARSLGTCLTTLHLAQEAEAAALLGIPDDVLQVALLPVAYTKGTNFKRATRPDPSTLIHWDTW
jgi:nitroreductase